MMRQEKIRQRLAAADQELRTVAIRHLRNVAAGRDTGFFTTEATNPWGKRSFSRAGSEVFAEASRLVSAFEKNGEDPSDTAAQQLLKAFVSANDVEQHNRLGPIRLAENLLAQLGAA